MYLPSPLRRDGVYLRCYVNRPMSFEVPVGSREDWMLMSSVRTKLRHWAWFSALTWQVQLGLGAAILAVRKNVESGHQSSFRLRPQTGDPVGTLPLLRMNPTVHGFTAVIRFALCPREQFAFHSQVKTN
jgi:hypothetical protein